MTKNFLLKEYAIMTFGSLLVAIAVVFFMVPGNLVMGSVSGLSLILTQIIPVKISIINLALNVILLLIGFIFVGREFGAKTVYTAIMIPILMYVLETIWPNQPSLTGDTWFDMLGCIFIVSAGQTLLFRVNASSGGLDILAKILNKYLGVDLGKACSAVGMLTVVCAIFVYNSATVVTGLIGTYLNGRVVDDFIGGFSNKKRVCILSDKHEEIQRFIREDINRGYTLYTATGGYEKRERIEILTILAQNEYQKLIPFVKEIDPDAFMTVSSVNEVVGTWNYKGEPRKL